MQWTDIFPPLIRSRCCADRRVSAVFDAVPAFSLVMELLKHADPRVVAAAASVIARVANLLALWLDVDSHIGEALTVPLLPGTGGSARLDPNRGVSADL